MPILASSSRRVTNYGDHPNHETYVAALQAQHGRKRGFWEG
ncbi:DUF6880 family protein [Sphingobium sp. RAC03]